MQNTINYSSKALVSSLNFQKNIQEYLRRRQVKKQQHMIDTQAPYTVAEHLKKTI